MIKDWEYDVINQVPFSKQKGIEDSNLYLVNTMQEWKALHKLLMSKKLVACDTETTGFDYFNDDRIVGMSFGWNKDHFYVPVRHVDSLTGGTQPEQLDMADLRDDLRLFFARQDVYTIWHNGKFDRHFYKADDIDISTPFHDTTFLWHLFDENAPKYLKVIASGWTDTMRQRHKGLFGPAAAASEKELSNWRAAESKGRRDHLRHMVMSRADELKLDLAHQDKNRTQIKKWVTENELKGHPYEDVKKEDIHYGYVPIELMTAYACMDTFLTFALYEKMTERLDLSQDLINVYLTELKLSDALFHAEEHGALVDREYLAKLDTELTEECVGLRANIFSQIGEGINLDSGDQLVAAFLKKGAKLTKKTNTGKLAMDASVLAELGKHHPVANDILYLRGTEKILSTYVHGIQTVTAKRPYVHMSFNQNVTTGRMSCRDPNLQNIPRKDTRIRQAFVCPEDYYFVFADYSQVEVRLTAHYSEDPIMLDAYSRGQDIHTRTASEMFAVPYDELISVLGDDTHEYYKKFESFRSTAKTINFGIIYGVGAPGLSHQIPRPERYEHVPDRAWIDVCQKYIDRYFEKYRYVKRFINKCKREVKKNAEIPNYFGRIRHLPHINAHKIVGDEYRWMSGKAERQAANFVIQSTAADVFKTATVRVAEEVFKGTNSHIINLVHDEIQSYIHKDELYLLNKKRDVMEDFDFIVPLKVDFAYSTTSWADKKGIAA